MKNKKLNEKQIEKISAIQKDYEKKVNDLVLECQNKLQAILDNYNLQKIRKTIEQ
jgi:hypothetical protein